MLLFLLKGVGIRENLSWHMRATNFISGGSEGRDFSARRTLENPLVSGYKHIFGASTKVFPISSEDRARFFVSERESL